MKYISVAALTSGKNAPSARFRIRQHIEPLKKEGIHVREYVPAISKYEPAPKSLHSMGAVPSGFGRVLWKCIKIAATIPSVTGSRTAQIIWLERGIHPGLLTFEPVLKRPYILDVDDAIWLTPPFGRFAVKRISKNAAMVLAGNNYIADWFSTYAKDIRIVPTGVDTTRIRPSRSEKENKRKRGFRIGWIGTSSNFDSLYLIEKPLKRFLRNNDAELWIISDLQPKFTWLPPERLKFIRWSPVAEVKILNQMDVGIMPLVSSEWSLGKCSFKMLQYMAAGLPVVVSPIGMNNDVLSVGPVGYPAVTDTDWYDALSALYFDTSLASDLGRTGRLIVETHFERSVVSKKLARIFHELG